MCDEMKPRGLAGLSAGQSVEVGSHTMKLEEEDSETGHMSEDDGNDYTLSSEDMNDTSGSFSCEQSEEHIGDADTASEKSIGEDEMDQPDNSLWKSSDGSIDVRTNVVTTWDDEEGSSETGEEFSFCSLLEEDDELEAMESGSDLDTEESYESEEYGYESGESSTSENTDGSTGSDLEESNSESDDLQFKPLMDTAEKPESSLVDISPFRRKTASSPTSNIQDFRAQRESVEGGDLLQCVLDVVKRSSDETDGEVKACDVEHLSPIPSDNKAVAKTEDDHDDLDVFLPSPEIDQESLLDSKEFQMYLSHSVVQDFKNSIRSGSSSFSCEDSTGSKSVERKDNQHGNRNSSHVDEKEGIVHMVHSSDNDATKSPVVNILRATKNELADCNIQDTDITTHNGPSNQAETSHVDNIQHVQCPTSTVVENQAVSQKFCDESQSKHAKKNEKRMNSRQLSTFQTQSSECADKVPGTPKRSRIEAIKSSEDADLNSIMHSVDCGQLLSPLAKLPSTDSEDQERRQESVRRRVSQEDREAKRQRRRAKVTQELLNTEETYLRHLKLVVKVRNRM